MKRLNVFLVSIVLCSGISFAGLINVVYSVENLSDVQWRYHYEISNNGLDAGIRQFTVWFDHAKYASIQIASDSALEASWDQLVWQPNETLKSSGGFDALAISTPIEVGETITGFSVSFTWNGQDIPGRQFFEIVNPDNPSEVLDNGFTVLIPEPTSLAIILVGICFFKGRFKINH